MQVSVEQARALLELQRLAVPDADVEEIALRLSTWLSALEEIEAELGPAMDEVDPVPPVFPREETWDLPDPPGAGGGSGAA